MQVQWDQIISYYLLYSLGGFLILAALVHMLYKRRTPTAIIAWLLLMVIAPYLFALLYFLFGVRKRWFNKEKTPLAIPVPHKDLPAAHNIDTLLRSNGIPPSTNDNSFELYTDGIDAYTNFINTIKDAKHSISLSTYVLKHDTVTSELFELLIEKSKAGIDVRILTDTLGSRWLYLWQLPLNRLKAAGVQISFFMPPLTFSLLNPFNLRYHRKIYLIDDKVLFSGGMNLAKEYMGPHYMEQRWIDTLYRCEGSIVSYYIDIFEADWAYANQLPDKKAVLPEPVNKGHSTLQVIPSGPDIPEDALLEAIIYGIHKASKRIWIVSPYFTPDENILQALRIAYHRNIDIKLITPKRSDHLIADLTRSSYLRELQDLGIEVALYNGPFLHAKAILFDDDAMMVGSINLDNRSLLLNYEVVTIAYSKEQIGQMERWMEGVLQSASRWIEPVSKTRQIFENLMRIFALQI